MKTIYIVLIAIAVVVAGFVGIYFSANNTAIRMETEIVAIQENSMNVATQYQNLIFEAAQVPEMQRDDLKEVITAALEGRYGDDGSRAVFQAIAEDNPKIDSTVYIKLQQIMQSGRKDFEREQTRMIDAVRVYKTALGTMPKGMFIKMAGYPTIDLEQYKPITTNRVDEMFKTGKEEHLKLRP